MPSTKRPRSNAEENRAECPYTIRTRLPTQVESRQHFSKKRKSEGPDEERKAEWHWQNSPFNPKGKFKTNETVDVKYAVDPPAGWQAMTRYSSFVCKFTSVPPSPEHFMAIARARPAQLGYPGHHG
jgi:hypothetical protein